MNIYINLATLRINIFAIIMVYTIIKKLDKKEILIFIATSFAIMYILVSIIYWISGFGIDSSIHKESKNFVIFLFVPINIILTIPYSAVQYMKFRKKKIKRDELSKKITIAGTVLIIVLILEGFYFKKIQKNIGTITDSLSTNNEEQSNNVVENEEVINNVNETIDKNFENSKYSNAQNVESSNTQNTIYGNTQNTENND